MGDEYQKITADDVDKRMLTLFGGTVSFLKLFVIICIIHPMHSKDRSRSYMHRKSKQEFLEQIGQHLLFSTFKLHPKRDHNANYDFSKFVRYKNTLKQKEDAILVKRFDNLDKRHPPYFQRVLVASRDDPKPVPTSDLREYPYYNSVRLSIGCTGTLITPSYVLTAAHCVHTGKHFKENVDLLKVEILHRINYRMHHIEEILIPRTWIESSDDPPSFQSAFDYAVIKLLTPVMGRTTFTPFYIPSPIISDEIYFLGYSWYTNLQLWKSVCSGWGSRTWYNGNILVSHCDSVVGNSGAAVFLEDRRTNERRIIGVLSSTSKTVGNLKNSQVTLTSLWTEEKINNICSIIAPEGGEYGVCVPQINNYENSEFKRLPLYG